MKVAVAGLDPGFHCDGHMLDEASARQNPQDMIGRLLSDGDLLRPQRIVTPKKPPAPSIRCWPIAKRSAAKR